ncbi:MAG: stage III sporulation protein AE [Paenibacillaceae bacterium]
MGTYGKVSLLLLFLLVCMMFVPYVSLAAPLDHMIGEQSEKLPTQEIENYWNQLSNEYGGYFPENRTPTFKELIIPGGEGFSLSHVLQAFLKFFFFEIVHNGKLLASIIILTVFSSILQTVQSAFERNTVSKVAYAICYLVIVIIAINSFSVAIGYAKSAIENMIHFMIAMIPLLLTLLASIGNVTTVSVLHPLIVFMIHIVGTMIYTIVFPLLFFSAILHIVSSLTDKYKVTQLANLLRTISVGLLVGMLTIFLGVITVQGATGSVTDGVTIRTAKYITGNFVPVVGKMFTDAADTVITASLLVKNAVGLTGVFILIMLCSFPAIKILSLALIYNLAGAMMQPLGDSPIVGCLQTIGKSLVFVFAALAAVGLMFFFALTIIITSGNVAVMMR